MLSPQLKKNSALTVDCRHVPFAYARKADSVVICPLSSSSDVHDQITAVIRAVCFQEQLNPHCVVWYELFTYQRFPGLYSPCGEFGADLLSVYHKFGAPGVGIFDRMPIHLKPEFIECFAQHIGPKPRMVMVRPRGANVAR